MKIIGIGCFALAFVLAYHLQHFVMPRWGLEALELREYFVFSCGIVIVTVLSNVGIMCFKES